ncbi:MAG: hypothetical protein ABI857_07145 [Acidobacteriota bacterium]
MSSLLGLDNEDTSSADRRSEVEQEQLTATAKSGASWFYWIAGLSAINSIAYMSGSSLSFLAGLGFTQLAAALVDVAIDNGAPDALKIVAIVFNFFLVALFAFIGYYANKRFSVAFVIGIVIYLLDGLLLLLLGELFGAAFHAFALFFIIRGFLACRTFNSQTQPNSLISTPPPAV